MQEIPKKNRGSVVTVRLTEDEHDYLEYRQKFIGAKSLSAYIRYAAISKKITVFDKDSLKKIMTDHPGYISRSCPNCNMNSPYLLVQRL